MLNIETDEKILRSVLELDSELARMILANPRQDKENGTITTIARLQILAPFVSYLLRFCFTTYLFYRLLVISQLA